jgi:hypothetical protein
LQGVTGARDCAGLLLLLLVAKRDCEKSHFLQVVVNTGLRRHLWRSEILDEKIFFVPCALYIIGNELNSGKIDRKEK